MKKYINIFILILFIINNMFPILSHAIEENNITSGVGYYSSLNAAIEDANNSSTQNANSNERDGKVSLAINNNKYTITLLKNIEEENELIINNDIEIKLNGKRLNIIAKNSKTVQEEIKNGILIAKNKTLNIDGTVNGSEIFHEEAFKEYFYMFNVEGNIKINGGKYTNTSNESGAWFINVTDTYAHNIEVENIELNLNALFSTVAIKTSINVNNSRLIFKNNKCKIRNNEKVAAVIYGVSNSIIENNEINISSENGNVRIVYAFEFSDCKIINNEIESMSKNGISYGITIGKNCLVLLNNNIITSVSEKNWSYGITSGGLSRVENSEFKVICKEINNKGSRRNY